MGMITVAIEGSFKPCQLKRFSAMHGGHAEAVAEVIAWLSNDVLPAAIAQDHKLQSEGAYPSKGFGVRAADLDKC